MTTFKSFGIALVLLLYASLAQNNQTRSENFMSQEQAAVETSKAGMEQRLDKMAASLKS